LIMGIDFENKVLFEVKRLRYGNTNTFFICGEKGNLLIDTDYAGTLPAFYKAIKEQNIKVNDITYVLATHYHPDHMGIVSELMRQGVKLLLIDIQVPYVHFSDEIFNREKHLEFQTICVEEAHIIKCEESRCFLHEIGIEGEILSTPSHSGDSVSLVLDSGECFVGDLEPFHHIEAYDENEALKKDWKSIMDYHPKMIYYSHIN